MKRLFALLLCAICLTGGVFSRNTPALANSRNMPLEAQDLLERITEGALQRAGASDLQAWLNGPLAGEAGVTAEWYVLALAHEGYDLSAYRSGLRAFLDGRTVRSATTRLKYAMALLASGAPADDPYITAAMAESVGGQGLMSWVWGLHLLSSGVPGPADADAVIGTILSLQFSDGGWALHGDVSDPDVTAMVLQALAPHQTGREDVQNAVDRAVTLLSAVQQPDGGYRSYGIPNPESTAQVLTALSALGIDSLTDPRFIKDGATLLDGLTPYLLPDASLSHTAGGPANHNATAQTFLALTAYRRFLAGQESLYVLPPSIFPKTTPAPDTSTVFSEATAFSEAIASPDGRVIASLAITGLAAAVCLLLLVLGTRHWKNFLAVAVITAAAIFFVLTTRFQSAADYYSVTAVHTGAAPAGTVTLSIRCDTVAGRADYIPGDGVILAETVFPIAEGDTVYAVLTDAARSRRIHLETSGGPGLVYVEGLAYLYEQAFGDLSGWLYSVNGETYSLGCDQYVLKDGDTVCWAYTLQMGDDLK